MFYTGLYNIDYVDKETIEKVLDEEEKSYGRFKYKTVIVNYLDIPLNEEINIYENTIKSSYEVPDGKKVNEFKKKLNTFIKDELRNIPAVQVEYEIKDGRLVFSFSNQIPYKKGEEINSSIVIEPMLKLLLVANVKALIFYETILNKI